MKEIKNKEAVIEQLAEMLMKFDKSFNQYNTDVYLYYNEETQEATLDEFVYVGNSWRDDDHITIYTDKEHYDNIYEHMDDLTFHMSDALDMDRGSLKKSVAEYFEIDVDNVERYHMEKWAEKFHYEKMHEYYNEWFINENRSDYVERAEMIIERFEEE